VRNLLDSAVLIHMNVQALRLVIHRAHAVGLQNTVFLGEVGLREGLFQTVSTCQRAPCSRVVCESLIERDSTHYFIVLLAELLAHELAHPVIARGAAVLGHETGNYERHVDGCLSCGGVG